MPDVWKVGLAILVFGGLIWAATRLLRQSQEGDPSKRGRDSSEPGGFYDETNAGGPD